MRAAPRVHAGGRPPCWLRCYGRPQPYWWISSTLAWSTPTIPPPFSTASPSGGARRTRCSCCSWRWRPWPQAICWPAAERSRPPHFRRQRHQDGLDIAAGHQPELGAAVVEEVELNIASAPRQLVVAFLRRPALVHVPAHQLGIDLQKRLADIAGEGEVALEVSAVEIVEKNAAHAARLAAVRQVEILVAPFFEARIVGRIV